MPTLVDILKYQLVLDDSQFKATAAQADAQANQLAGSIGGKLTTAVGLLAGAFAALKIGDFLKDATLTAARTEVLGTALSVVGKNAGVSQGELALLEEQVKALGITTQEARTSIIRFIQSGLPLSKIAELARLAQDSAVTAGINSSEAFERLTRGIQTGQIELLRTAGVFVSIESELNKFAKSTGKAREGLSDIERQTVILNAVLAQGSKLAGNYEAAMGDVGKQLTSMPRFFEELQNAIGTFFLPVMEQGVGVASRFLKVITELLTNEEILRARRTASGDSSLIQQEEELNRLLEERRKLGNQIIEGEGKYALLLAQNNTATTLLAGGANIALEKMKRDLEEINKLIDAMSQKKIESLIGPVDERASTASARATAEAERIAKKAEDRAKRTADRLAELAKTPTIGGDIAEGIDKQWEIAKAAILAEPIEVEVNFKIPTAEQAKIQSQINEIFKSNAPDQGAMFDILGIQELVEQNNQAAQEVQDKFIRAYENVGTVASAIFRNVFSEASGFLDSFLNASANFAVGNLAGGIAGTIDALFSVFGTGTDKLVASQGDLIRAIENWRSTILDLNTKEKEGQTQAANAAIDFAANVNWPEEIEAGFVRAMLESAGIFVPANASLDQMLVIARSILAGIDSLRNVSQDILDSDTKRERSDLIGGASTFEEAMFMFESFKDLFEISAEEQLALLEDMNRRFGTGLSDRDRIFLAGQMDDLRESNEASRGASQTERSIARVSERQADSLISGIATMDFHLREGFQSVVDAIMSTVAGASDRLNGGTEVNIDTINVYPPTAENRDVAKALVSEISRELRSVGNARLV